MGNYFITIHHWISSIKSPQTWSQMTIQQYIESCSISLQTKSILQVIMMIEYSTAIIKIFYVARIKDSASNKAYLHIKYKIILKTRSRLIAYSLHTYPCELDHKFDCWFTIIAILVCSWCVLLCVPSYSIILIVIFRFKAHRNNILNSKSFI